MLRYGDGISAWRPARSVQRGVAGHTVKGGVDRLDASLLAKGDEGVHRGIHNRVQPIFPGVSGSLPIRYSARDNLCDCALAIVARTAKAEACHAMDTTRDRDSSIRKLVELIGDIRIAMLTTTTEDGSISKPSDDNPAC